MQIKQIFSMRKGGEGFDEENSRSVAFIQTLEQERRRHTSERQLNMQVGHLHKIQEKAINTTKRMLVIALYLGTLLSLFSLHRQLIDPDHNVLSHIGFSFLNGWALAKVILVGQELHVGDGLRTSRVIYRIILKSAIFAILLYFFRCIEEGILGHFHGKGFVKGIMEAGPSLGNAHAMGIILVCIIMFVALIPFFAYFEIEKIVGPSKLRSAIFGKHNDASISGPTEDNSVSKSDSSASTQYPEDSWYYIVEDEVLGPVTESQIILLAKAGKLHDDSLLHNVHIGADWARLSSVFESGITREQRGI
jgi:hypothetical protein